MWSVTSPPLLKTRFLENAQASFGGFDIDAAAAGGIGTAVAGVRRIQFKRAVFHPVVWVVVSNLVSLSAESLTLVKSQRARDSQSGRGG